MPGLLRRSRRTFYHFLARTLLGLLRCLPTGSGRRFCRGLALTALALRRRDRALAERNLALAFPESTSGARAQRLRSATAALGENLFDALTLERAVRREFADIDGDDTIAAIEALRRPDRGVLLLTGHLGCWELLGAYLAGRLDGLTVVTGRIHNRSVDRLLNDRRRRTGLRVVHRDGDLRPLIAALRDGRAVAVLMDQNTRVENRDVPFFGVAAPTPAGFARLALRYRVPILPVAIARAGNGHRVRHRSPIDPAAFGGETGEFDLLRECNLHLECFIREHPDEWVWFHDRWDIREGKVST